MAFRNIIIESPAHLSVRKGQLIIRTDCEHSVPVEDISAILVESNQSTLTAAALSCLGQSGCLVFFCDDRHLPCSAVLPYAQHSRGTAVLHAQLDAGLPIRKRLWQKIVAEKIRNQARCLSIVGNVSDSEYLGNLANRVRSGDPDNCEATAAQRYFPALFGQGFARGADNGLNAALNYGYAVLRGCVARNIAVYGFLPALGLHHCSELNGFNLADDLIEPFRPVVDLVTFMYFSEGSAMNPERKHILFNCLNHDIISGGQHHSVSYAVERLVQSLSGALCGRETALILPELTEIRQHSYE